MYGATVTLEALAEQYQTDKREGEHGYTRYYELHLAAVREHVRAVLEIGVFKGASMRMWRDYFPHAKVWGVDRDPKAKQHEEERILVRIGDQRDGAFLREIACEAGSAEGFDLVVDDGGHRMSQQRASFEVLWPYVRPSGFYAVEDLHTSYWQTYCDEAPFVGALKALVDDVNVHGKAQFANKLRNVKELELTEHERTVEAVHFYPSLCVVQKMPPVLRRSDLVLQVSEKNPNKS
ncbi:MAG: class I SAM-dependent methyltransferase [Limisphaerales bacterium]